MFYSILGIDIGIGLFILLHAVLFTILAMINKTGKSIAYAVVFWSIFIFFLLRVGGIV